MLSKTLNHMRKASADHMMSVSKRGLYAPGTEPKVFINKHTKVICQGMTGKHVRFT